MHEYSIDLDERKVIPLYVAGISIATTYFLKFLLEYFRINIPWWIDAPSVMGIYLLLYKLFDNYLWRINFMKRIRLSKIPDINGKWTGHLTSSHSKFEKNTDCNVHIKQKWSSILIILQTVDSRSYSFSGAIFTKNPAGNELIYEYLNEPFPIAREQMHIHRGTSIFLLKSDNTIEGQYYTGRDRMNFGAILLKKEN